ncbi:RNA/RNP complex-1-interacting phosphatase-like [Centruroides sculpturatus]|uniref:RNA/RNP complex-1-interacting phosphatase-like n=1 Tax=Centruroides sculpturatus TaxID=218467 RepID=UPI000C6E59A3|nr:RNA/RNP complex-1-interacting phosphatase-like [Centruroides sculpturatus]
MPKNGIPDRWESYTPFGKVIGQTRFIAFKVPLKENLCRILPATMRFTPSNLISSIDKLGMVIDLTNTRRYYNSAEITDCGVSYLKIFCRGKVVPDRNVVQKFFEAVDDFLRNNDKGLIGVHCTHGVNRTGYLICKYMIDKLRYDAKDAILEFNNARGHDIERVEYINHLCRIENGESNGKDNET